MASAPANDRSGRLVALCFGASMLVSVGLGAGAVLAGGLRAPWFGAFAIAAAVGWILLLALRRRGRPVQAFLALAMLNLLVVAPELGLRAIGFENVPGIQFGWPRPEHFVALQRDPELFWKLDPRNPAVNSLGFPGREIVEAKEPGVVRVVFLGDSCTIPPPGEKNLDRGYPSECASVLNGRTEATKRVESVTLAVAGYSSHQGRILAEKYASKLQPDAVVIYYGWNDHWRAYDTIDADKVVAAEGAAQRAGRKIRLLQLVGWIASKLSNPQAKALDVPRVPADHYRKNVTAMARQFRDKGIPVVMVTAPTSHRVVGVPDYLVAENFVDDKEHALRIHTEYTDIVRAVAKETGAVVLDLERECNEMSAERLRGKKGLFIEDGIHFSRAGIEWAAQRMAATLAAALGH